MLIITPNISVPLSEFELSFSRSSGPGGQNVNKVNSKVTLRWDVTNTRALPLRVKRRLLAQLESRLTKQGEVLVVSDQYRDQSRNLAVCLERLRGWIEAAVPEPKLRRKTKPSKAAKERRLEGKKRRASVKAGRGRNSSNSDN